MTDKSFLAGPTFSSIAGGSFESLAADAKAKAAEEAKSLVKTKVTPKANILKAGVSTPTPKDSNKLSHQETASSSDFSLDFQPNILDNYDAITYHFKLFMVSTAAARSGNVLNPDNQVIIAESGVTDLTIDKIELNTIAVPSVESGTGTQTTLKFEIVEPSGAGLLDKMFYESIALGIGNWLVMPCYLQLTFKGRDPITSEAGTGDIGDIGTMSWVWPIKLTETKANVTTVGTRYEFSAIVYDEFAQGNSYFAIQHNIALTGVTTFQSAMTDLEDKLNQDQYLKLLDNYSIPDTYKIIVDPKIANFQIKTDDDNKNSYRSGDFKILKDKTATFNAGTGIDKIIDALLANTEEYQRGLTGAVQGAGSGPGTINQNIDQMKKFWRVTTEVRPIEFDKRRQDNAVEITVFVFEYDLGASAASPTTTGGTPGSQEASRRRLNEYIEKKILRKKYNYMFTGLNDQIITFDLNMNFAFAATLSRFGGAYYDSSAKDMGPVAQNRAEDELKVTEQVRKVITMQNNATKDNNPGKTQKAIDDAKLAVAKSTLDDTTKARYTVLLDHSKPADRLALLNSASQTGGIQADGSIDKNYTQAKRTASSLASSPTDSNLKFVADVNISSSSAKQAYQDFLTTSKGKLRPIPFREAQQESSVGAGVEANSTSGKNKLASLFSTVLYSDIGANLVHIKLNIKGDPYWLSPAPIAGAPVLPYKRTMGVDQAMEILKSGHKITNTVNLFGTDNFIILRFRTPRIFDETVNPTTSDPFTEVETFSGVYRVLTVIHKFEMGKFSQELTCLLDPVINTIDFIEQVEANAATLDTPTTVNDLVSRGAKVIPDTAQGTQRIMGAVDKAKGVVETARNSAGQVRELGAQTIGQVGNAIKSNVPPLPTTDLVAVVKSKFPNIG